MRDSFIFYRSFFESMKDLPDEEKLKCFEALCEYALDGEDKETYGFSKMFMTLVRPQIDANNKKSDGGKSGGRPKKDDEDKKNHRLSKKENIEKEKETIGFDESENKKTIGFEKRNHRFQNQKPNVNDNVNVNVNVNDNANVNENVKEVEEEEEEGACARPKTTSLYDVFESEFGRPLSPLEFEQVEKMQQEYGIDLVKLALSEAVMAGARSFRYIETVLNNWSKAGIKTVDEARRQIEAFHSRGKGGNGELPDWYGDYEPAQGRNTVEKGSSGPVESRKGKSGTNTDEDIKMLQKALRNAQKETRMVS